MVLIFTMSAGLMVGIIEMIVLVVTVDESAIAAIFAATLSAFWRNWIFCASVNVIPVRVAPTIRVFVKFAFVNVAFVRFAFVKMALVMFAFVNVAFVRFAFVRIELVRFVATKVADIKFLPVKSKF